MEEKKKPGLLKAVATGARTVSEKFKQYQADAPKRETEAHMRYLRKAKMETERLESKAKLLKQRQAVARLTPAQPGMGFGGSGMFSSNLFGQMAPAQPRPAPLTKKVRQYVTVTAPKKRKARKSKAKVVYRYVKAPVQKAEPYDPFKGMI
jgi:uncharacterized FAD-dependent dehydrogenase